MEGAQANKAHRQGLTRKPAKAKIHQNGHNAKAFAVSAPGKLQRQAARLGEIKERALHVPMVDRTPEDDPPPVIIAVVGPPGTGKTTLIKSLVRHLTKTTLTEVKGPITVVSGKRRRVTFMEVANDLNSMIDAAKIADLVLLLIDGNFGLEMETMEFLNIAQHHGMPRVLGVATHLDLFKLALSLRTAKKRLKHRLWTEVYQGAKLFYLSGVLNGRYPDRETLNLLRFISVMKFRPLKWRNEHPYLLADRVTDLTHPQVIAQNRKCDRTVAVYGYLHGTPLAFEDAPVHIAGAGDFIVSQVEKLPDPCPTPHYEQKLEEIERERIKAAAELGEPIAKTTRRRKRLDDKQKIIYAPMSDVGGLLMDKDAVYIDVGTEAFSKDNVDAGEGEKMVTDLQEATKSMAERFEDDPGLQLFTDGTTLQHEEVQENLEQQGLLDEVEQAEILHNTGRTKLRKPKMIGKKITDDAEFDEVELGDEDVEIELNQIAVDLGERYKEDELEFAEDSEIEDDNTAIAQRLRGRETKTWNINKLLYSSISPGEVLQRWKGLEVEEDIEENDEEFFKKKAIDEDFKLTKSEFPELEILRLLFCQVGDDDDLPENGYQSLKNRFLIAPKLAENDGEDDTEAENVDGDFEDLEADENEDFDLKGGEAEEDQTNNNDDFADFDEEERKAEMEEPPVLTTEQKRQLAAEKKAKLKLQFEEEEEQDFGADDFSNEADNWYEFQKAKMAKQLEINKAELEAMDPTTRLKIEGYRAGSYVKLVFKDVPCEFIENLSPEYPIVVGGLLPTEMRFGVMNSRIRRHRWHKKILKSLDPLILSLGWRRFQTLPIYTTSDSRTRNRMLKYTPEHAYCFALFYGPLVAPNTPFIGFNILDEKNTTGLFRVAATGIIQDLNSLVEIVKKLKLVGYPYKIFRNTAFIKDMFSNALEVAKFEGAQIKTVSGIRGEIKRALSKPEGHFRATFEDKILMSDTIFLKTWYPVKIKHFYNPVTSLLMSNKGEWQGMRLTGQIRRDQNIETPLREDSSYKPIERKERQFGPLKVPRTLKAQLPFKAQIVEKKPRKRETYMAKRAVVLSAEEKKARDLLEKIESIKREKELKRKSKLQEKLKEKLKELAKKAEFRKEKEMERKKEYFQRAGKRENLQKSGGGGKRQKR